VERKGRMRAGRLEGSEVEAAEELPSSAQPAIFTGSWAIVCASEGYFDRRWSHRRLLLDDFNELLHELLLVLDFPTIITLVFLLLDLLLGVVAVPVGLLLLPQQLLQSAVANLLEVVLVVHLLHVVLPRLDYSELVGFWRLRVWQEELTHESVHELDDVFEEGVVGLHVFVEAVDDQRSEGGVLLREEDDLSAELNLRTDAYDDVLDEVIAVAEPLVLQQL
jgi:hypothetical protein